MEKRSIMVSRIKLLKGTGLCNKTSFGSQRQFDSLTTITYNHAMITGSLLQGHFSEIIL